MNSGTLVLQQRCWDARLKNLFARRPKQQATQNPNQLLSSDHLLELRWLVHEQYRRIVQLTVAMPHLKQRDRLRRASHLQHIGALEMDEDLYNSINAALLGDAPKCKLDYVLPFSSRFLAVN